MKTLLYNITLALLISCFAIETQCSSGNNKVSIESARIAEAYNEHIQRFALGPGPAPGPGPNPNPGPSPKTSPKPTPAPNGPKSTTLSAITTAKKSLFCPFNPSLTCNTSSKYQTFDGTCNNLNNPLYGAMNTPYKRFLTPVYGDGSNTPRSLSTTGATLPNPRKISTSLLKDQFISEQRWFHIFASFGQFMVHDMTSLASLPGNQIKQF